MGRSKGESLLKRVMALGHSEKLARAYIMAGRVRVSGEVCTHVGRQVGRDELLSVQEPPVYPGRGSLKLQGALDGFAVVVAGRIALDIGAAHGGFTAVLLERGARRIYAVDVAYGMLDFRLRTDDRVVVLERHNIRHLNSSWFSAPDLNTQEPWILTADLSFISLRTVLPVLVAFGRALPAGWEGVILIKPQFEDSEGTDRGILRDPVRRERVLRRVADEAGALGLSVLGLQESVLQGAHGNQEVFAHVRAGAG